MEQMTVLVGVIVGGIGLIGTICGIIFGGRSAVAQYKQENRADAAQDATIRNDIEYIKRGVDDLKYDLKSQKADFNALAERVARVEESCKSLHKRVDRFDDPGR